MPPALGYVMCSRPKEVEDLFITGRFDPKKIRCNPKALEEAHRLNEISLTNLPKTTQHSNQLFGFVNIRSLSKNFEHLESDFVMLQKDVLFVTETWIDSKS